ncbi:cutinase family protein [Amycolatopsis sp. EV170708-02-1]|uniref:cutinase family protein n=1 Tax=Amycolatopsis sp. EV170708-02-1 TaxID=2919322 RepID=UPI001F0BB178|nr:cutinase family protein [Amycolatopsis sp. EV170708-02-1]UMO99936.1 cutinase family protein [Amycolatopsis sp. EV170708-02-1]
MSARWGRWTAAIGLAVGAVAIPAPVAEATAACPDLDVVFARGTTEIPGPGVVGKPLIPAVQRALPGKSVTSYAVDYAASIDQSSAGPGATDMTRHVVRLAAACPSTKFVLGGLSQGASVTDIAIGLKTGLGTGETVPAGLADRVVAVVAFGNPLGGLFRQTIKDTSAVYGPKALELCNLGDLVCGGLGTRGPGFGHLSYAFDGSVDLAARFIGHHYR